MVRADAAGASVYFDINIKIFSTSIFSFVYFHLSFIVTTLSYKNSTRERNKKKQYIELNYRIASWSNLGKQIF